jgi:hypothetical protein
MNKAIFLLASTGAALVMVTAPAPASAAQFKTCQNAGAGMGSFNDNACRTPGGTNTFDWKQIAAATNFAIRTDAGAVTTAPVTIESEGLVIKCDTSSFIGQLELAGKFKGTVTLGGCVFNLNTRGNLTNPHTCAVAAGTSFAIEGELVNGAGRSQVEFGPSAGRLFTDIKTEPGANCHEYKFEAAAAKKGQTCPVSGATVGATVHTLICTESGSRALSLNNETGWITAPMTIGFNPLERWRIA